MRYSPEDMYLWDSWFIKEDDVYHMFHLQAPKKLKFEDRHLNASVGHATSRDLINWEEQETALKAPKPNAIWTGSIIKENDTFYMFYTSVQPNLQQTIKLATSKDLYKWEKEKEILPPPKKYQMEKRGKLGAPPAWRDPYVFKDKNQYFMTISAREKHEDDEINGAIVLAKSHNLINWNIIAPILDPEQFAEMETSQLIKHNGKYYLFFFVSDKQPGEKPGFYCYYSDKVAIGYKPVNKNGLIRRGTDIYAIKLIEKDGNKWKALGFMHDNKNIGTLSEILDVKINDDKISIV